MKNLSTYLIASLVSSLTLMASGISYAGAKDDPFLTMGKVNQWEVRDTEGPDPQVIEGQFWAGYDLNKLWLKFEGERVDSASEELELQALYSRAISGFWNIQLGGRKDFNPEPERDWGVIALQGLAPYYVEVDASVFVGGAGRIGLRLEAEYEWRFTQQLILSPEIEINAYGHNDRDTGVGAGLSDAEIGLRLRYEIRREFAPYIGLNWGKKYGNTARFVRADGEDTEDSQIVLGLRAWY